MNQKVLDRISKLEQLVNAAASRPQNQQMDLSSKEAQEQQQDNAEAGSDLDRQFGRLVIDDKRSAYVSNVLWASLSDEVS